MIWLGHLERDALAKDLVRFCLGVPRQRILCLLRLLLEVLALLGREVKRSQHLSLANVTLQKFLVVTIVLVRQT